jgi:hypothetical protein
MEGWIRIQDNLESLKTAAKSSLVVDCSVVLEVMGWTIQRPLGVIS